MNRLKPERKALIAQLVAEGLTLRGVLRATGHHLVTVLRVLNEVGENCQRLHDENMRDLGVEAVQCDELWTYLNVKEARAAPRSGCGRHIHVHGPGARIQGDRFIRRWSS